MSLADIIAAKKKAALDAQNVVATVAATVPSVTPIVLVETPAKQHDTATFTDAMIGIHEHPALDKIEAIVAQAVAPTLIVAEPVISDAKRVLTFSEKMALRKAASEVVADVSAALQTTTDLPPAFQTKVADKIVAVLKDAREQEDMQREEYQQATEETRKSYKDIRNLVDSLRGTDDDSLADAMSDLKKSLIQNPSACMLMLDEEIGSMTIALRRLTQEALVASIKEPKEKKAAKDKVNKLNLTPEQMQAALDEL